MNFKVRLKNPVFWATIVPATAAFFYTLLGAFDITPAISENEVVNILLSIVTALTTLGVLVDPTTKGINDSERAMTYDEPN